jgi:hypothetical protein
MALAVGLRVAHPRMCPAQFVAKGASLTTGGKRGDGWTAVLRRQPAGIVDGQPQGGYTNSFEIICPDRSDDPDRDYREISAQLRQVRGPHPITDGITVCEKHLRLRQHPEAAHRPTGGWQR